MPHSRGRFVYIREISDRLISGPRIRKLGVLEDVEALARVGPLHSDISECQAVGSIGQGYCGHHCQSLATWLCVRI